MKLQSNDWKKRRTKEKISKIATASDEAFVLLILENIWDLEQNKRKFGLKVIRKKYSGAEIVISEEDLDACSWSSPTLQWAP